MTRLTKFEIESRLLRGVSISWPGSAKKAQELQLATAVARRLFSYLLTSEVRKPTDLPPRFVEGLLEAFDQDGDPANDQATSSAQPATGAWRLHAIETEGFGGLNSWGGGVFRYELDGESLLLEGANGSGKSSFAASIVWALTGERPRDQADGNAHIRQPVFSSDDKAAGDWPPLASYPDKVQHLKDDPKVRVTLELKDPSGVTATIERRLFGDKVHFNCSPSVKLEPALLEAGILMPARLAQMRLSGGGGRLTEAVQKLTGLDDLIAIGQMVEGLCHKAREFQSFKSKELAVAKGDFEKALALAQQALASINVTVPTFTTKDTVDPNGSMATFGRKLKDQAAELASVISNDISPHIDLKKTADQNLVISAIGAAEADLKAGIEGLEYWKLASTISAQLNVAGRTLLSDTASNALSEAKEALSLLFKSKKDSKFRLKAIGALWHAEHDAGDIKNCPLCNEKLQQELSNELEELRSVGAAATRTFDDNINAIIAKLDASTPPALRRINDESLSLEPHDALTKNIREQLASNERYSSSLIRLTEIITSALEKTPPSNTKPPIVEKVDDSYPANFRSRIQHAQRLLFIAEWFDAEHAKWKEWWTELVPATSEASQEKKIESERLFQHLSRLADALAKAEPFRNAAESMRDAWVSGTKARGYELEISKRSDIGEALSPLKSLGSLCESVAREAIEDLSGRVEKMLDDMLIAENFKFQSTDLHRKTGIVVHGGFTPSLRIDATLVANTSWLRALLWCFVFALREEAVQQLANDPFPIAVLDDPQATFDTYHRARWAQYIASLQHGPSKVQIIITTHEELFVDLITNDGVIGRQAIIAAAATTIPATILEGASLERRWKNALTEKTAAAAVDYLDRARVFVEGVLKIMLRGEAPKVHGLLLGQLRDLLRQLNVAGKAPWDAPVFLTLLGQLEGGRPEIKYLEGAHHTTGHKFGMQEGAIVEKFVRVDLRPRLERAFRAAREHRLLHGGMNALHAPPPTATLPEGYKSKVRSIPLTILGRAAALTSGRVADGQIDMIQLQGSLQKNVSLKNHAAVYLSAKTLEPAARRGDLLLVKEAKEPSSRSLVVAISNDKILARRFEISENQSDIAVLVAQAVNPREIAPPVVALKSTLTLHKVVGVLFGNPKSGIQPIEGSEVCDCGGEAAIAAATSGALGLVEVSGESAEPLALDGQYLIVKSPITPEDACKYLNGSPIIAEDGSGNCYFKRLHVLPDDQVILESLEISGDFPPIALALTGSDQPSLKQVWPVAGVLFELPD